MMRVPEQWRGIVRAHRKDYLDLLTAETDEEFEVTFTFATSRCIT